MSRKRRARRTRARLGYVRTARRVQAPLIKPWMLYAAGGAVFIGAAMLITGTKGVIGNRGPMTVKSVGNGQWLRPDAAAAFLDMVDAAARDGVTLLAGSAFRSVPEQAILYAQYVARLFAPPKVAAPGTSNHGLGIAVDIASAPTVSVHYNTPEFAWLTTNAGRFNFSWEEGKSVNEPWHWDYVG